MEKRFTITLKKDTGKLAYYELYKEKGDKIVFSIFRFEKERGKIPAPGKLYLTIRDFKEREDI